MTEIKITLETLYDILRNEKKKEDLQELDNSFFLDVAKYVREKKGLLDAKSEADDIFASGEKDKLEYEIKSIKRILKEIYEKREKKIIDIALNKSRTGSDIIDTSSMLKEEKDFYQEILQPLDQYRRGTLLKLFKGELPLIDSIKRSNTVKSESSLSLNTEIKTQPEKVEQEITKTDITKKTTEENHQEMTKVKFIHPMPSFVWKDMKVYGPYDEGDEVEIFPEVADLLVRKKRAEKI